MKYVYLIQSLENGYYKIGISKNPQKRIEQLSTGNSSRLKLIETHQSSIASKVEKTLHQNLKHLKKHGEWFDLSINEEVKFKEMCDKIESNYMFLLEQGNEFVKIS